MTGLISATEERAKADARRKLRDDVVELARSRRPRVLDAPGAAAGCHGSGDPNQTGRKDYGTLYEAELKVDTSPAAPRRLGRGV